MATSDTPKSLTWLITGCSSGFGLSLTRTIITSGRHTVIATSRNPSRTPSLVEEVQNAGGRWLALDVAQPGSCEALVKQLEEQEGIQIDVLVNNAGFNIFSPAETATEDEVRSQMETMFFGPLRLMQAVIPHMRERRRGTIVNFSSGASLMGNESMAVYAGAKGGLDALTRVLAKEVAPFNIRCLTVILGTFNTNFGKEGPQPSADLPADYNDTMVGKMISVISSGTLKPNGDKDKAMKAVYDVVVGEGPGQGKQDERLLLLGNDMVARVKVANEHLQHGLDVFMDATTSVAAEP